MMVFTQLPKRENSVNSAYTLSGFNRTVTLEYVSIV